MEKIQMYYVELNTCLLDILKFCDIFLMKSNFLEKQSPKNLKLLQQTHKITYKSLHFIYSHEQKMHRIYF